ncbi:MULTISPECIES: hypothetical protein [unclassified Spirosoma]|uniref:hypothetical protein n=1 Tax=unclassified Spirosoma TaxID=2621999 RepID=UPI001ACFADD1|nr:MULTISPECIES: hypothetical protein [unclassified Spirosoma]MBN8823763.1 hypothetical protein [Spirosoma sp.]
MTKIIRLRLHKPWKSVRLNVADIELSILTRQGLPHRVASLTKFEQQVQAWVEARNDKLSKVDWQFTAEDARIKLKRLYPSTIDG